MKEFKTKGIMEKYFREENEDGFTLIEILVVIAIIGVLTAIAVPVYLNQKQVAINATLQSDIKQMVNSQMDYIANGGNNYGAAVAIREGDTDNEHGTHSRDGITFIPSPGNYVRTPYITDTAGKAVGFCIIVWSPKSKQYPTEGLGLAWSSINNYDVNPTNCSTKA